jgi:hypothetical protein
MSQKVSAVYFFKFCCVVCTAHCKCSYKHGLSVSLCCNDINMATPLFICTKKEQCAVIWFLWADGVSGAEINWRQNTKDYCQKMLIQCPSAHCCLQCWDPLPIELWDIGASSVQSWPGHFRLPLVWSTQRCFMRPPVTKKWREWYMRGLSLNQKHSFMRAHESAWAIGPNALKTRETSAKMMLL